jgi:hypothetical protein
MNRRLCDNEVGVQSVAPGCDAGTRLASSGWQSKNYVSRWSLTMRFPQSLGQRISRRPGGEHTLGSEARSTNPVWYSSRNHESSNVGPSPSVHTAASVGLRCEPCKKAVTGNSACRNGSTTMMPSLAAAACTSAEASRSSRDGGIRRKKRAPLSLHNRSIARSRGRAFATMFLVGGRGWLRGRRCWAKSPALAMVSVRASCESRHGS